MLERHGLIRAFGELKKNYHILAVCAPAGYGKTVAVTQCLDKDPRAKAVFSIDEYDNNLASFCERFCAALRTCQPQNQTLNSIISHHSFSSAPDEFALRAISALSVRKQAAFVIDDLHLIRNNEVLQLLLVFIKRLPKNFQVILISRHELPPCFSELLIKGQAARISADQLLFTTEDIMALYKKRGRQITQEQANDIFQHTQGWAISINAFLLSGELLFDDEYEYLDQFIQSNIWEKWNEEIQNFMLKTANLRLLTPSLCEAMTGVPHSDKFIKKLVQKGAFITQIQKGTYRYHHLFQQFLKRKVEERCEEFILSLLKNEGDWHLSQMDFYSAIDCFIRCENHDGIAKCFELLADAGNSNFALGSLIPILKYPEVRDTAKKYPRLLFLLTWGAFAEGHGDDMIQFMDEYYSRHNEILAKYPTSAYTHLFLRIYDFRLSPSQMANDIGALCDIPNLSISQWSVSLHMPLLHRGLKDYSETAIGNVIENCMAMQSKIGWLLGEESSMLFKTLTAGLFYELGDLEKSYEYAAEAMTEMKSHFLTESNFCAMSVMVYVLDALCKESDEDSDEAASIIKSMSQMIEDTKTYQLSRNFKALSTRRNIMAGSIQSAEEWLNAQISESPTLYGMYADFTTCRAFIILEKYESAIILLKKISKISMAFNRPLDTIEAQILLAIAYWKKKGKLQNSALSYLYEAISTAHPYSHVQMFINDGAELSGMLHRLLNRVKQRKEKDEGLLSFIKLLYLETRGAHNIELSKTPSANPIKLTDKQKAVAHLLCQGKSYKEIAESLGIKKTGLRTHLRFIYNKLDVTNGVDAAAKIKAMNLLD